MKGIALIKRVSPEPSSTYEETAAAHEGNRCDNAHRSRGGIYKIKSFARDTLCLSVTGRITEPTVRQLKKSSTNISMPGLW